MTATPRVAIVGAGAASAGVAYALGNSDSRVTIFEKSRCVGGRAATRRKNDCRYDHGANYLNDDAPRVNRLVTETLDTEGLIDIDAPIHVFDESGTIEAGRGDDDRKWTYRNGITQLAKRLFARTDADVTTDTRIERIAREQSGTETATGRRAEDERDDPHPPDRDSGWRLFDTENTDLGGFDALVCTPPAPQTAALLADAEWDHDCRAALETAIGEVPFRTTLTAVLHYPFSLDVPYYALLNTDGSHEIGWVSREECKPGHVPDGESLLIVQMGTEWSAAHYDDPAGEMAADAAQLVAELLGDDRLADPDWTDRQGWRYAQPEDAIETAVLDRARDHDLHFAGDWLEGAGRIHLALESGLDTGERLIEHLACETRRR